MSALSGKVIVVTGASSGIGWATALELAKRNAKVVVAARRADRLNELAEAILKAGGHGLAVECDVTDESQVRNLIDTAGETFGAIDVLINNAGAMPLSLMDRCDTQAWDQMIDVNIKGVLYGIAAVLPSMMERESGHIVNVSSIAGRRVFPGGSVYCATKFAVHALSEGLRAEMAERNIRVTIIAPGLVRTELQGHIKDERINERLMNLPEDFEWLESEDIAASIIYALEAPGRVNVNEILVRPTKQVN